VKVEYAHGIPSVCLEDFDDEVADEYVNLVYDEVVADDALAASKSLLGDMDPRVLVSSCTRSLGALP
jgi:hypothetical protein